MPSKQEHQHESSPSSPSSTAVPSLDPLVQETSDCHPPLPINLNAVNAKDSESQPPTPTPNPNEAIPAPPVAAAPPPNGGYGWICVLSCGLINGHTWGINSSYGVFLAYYLANDVFPGATNLDYALVGGLSIAAAMLVSPLATYTTGLYGTRTTLMVGVVLQTVSLVTASFAGKTWQLFCSQGACFGFGGGGWGLGF